MMLDARHAKSKGDLGRKRGSKELLFILETFKCNGSFQYDEDTAILEGYRVLVEMESH